MADFEARAREAACEAGVKYPRANDSDHHFNGFVTGAHWGRAYLAKQILAALDSHNPHVTSAIPDPLPVENKLKLIRKLVSE